MALGEADDDRRRRNQKMFELLKQVALRNSPRLIEAGWL